DAYRRSVLVRRLSWRPHPSSCDTVCRAACRAPTRQSNIGARAVYGSLAKPAGLLGEPEHEADLATARPPALGQLADLVLAGVPAQFEVLADDHPQGHVAGRNDVEPPEAAQQHVFGRPAADAELSLEGGA